jgi:hypothetical protein
MNGLILRIIDALILAIFGIIAIGPPNIPFLKPFNVKFELNIPFRGNYKSNIESENLYVREGNDLELQAVFTCDYLDKKMEKKESDAKAYNIKKELPKKSTLLTPSSPKDLKIIGSEKKEEEKKEEKKQPSMQGVSIN